MVAAASGAPTGPAPCTVPLGPVPVVSGFCGTFESFNGGSYNTWYGSYGPGFPAPLGWGLCAESPASGRDYPDPAYNYLASPAPNGADTTTMNAVGFAISQAIAQGLWTNPSTSNDAAAAAKLFYDVTVWHTDMPTMDASLADQYNQLMTWYTAALGATAVPVLTTALSAPLPDTPLSITASAVLAFPGTTTAVPNSAVTLSVTDGTFAGGATSVVEITNAQGSVAVPVTASGQGPLTISASAPVGQLGLLFYEPTALDLGAQVIVSPQTAATTSSTSTAEIMTKLFVEKFNAAEPGQGIPGSTFNLFVQGTPPSTTPPTPPGTINPPGNTWFAQGTTDTGGHLGFTIPAGYSWCIQETSVPIEFVLDPALRCTGVITSTSTDPVRTIAVSEQQHDILLHAYKFNVAKPGQGIPGATYGLFVVGPFPAGFVPPIPPASISIPPNTEFFATGITDAQGGLSFTIPVGHAWCLQELQVPPGFRLDPGLHCTGILTSSSSQVDLTVALPELAMTGSSFPLGIGTFLIFTGLVLVRARRRQSRVS